jgi:hypothetical protein
MGSGSPRRLVVACELERSDMDRVVADERHGKVEVTT